jgi:hypothetical protein
MNCLSTRATGDIALILDIVLDTGIGGSNEKLRNIGTAVLLDSDRESFTGASEHFCKRLYGLRMKASLKWSTLNFAITLQII